MDCTEHNWSARTSETFTPTLHTIINANKDSYLYLLQADKDSYLHYCKLIETSILLYWKQMNTALPFYCEQIELYLFDHDVC